MRKLSFEGREKTLNPPAKHDKHEQFGTAGQCVRHVQGSDRQTLLNCLSVAE